MDNNSGGNSILESLKNFFDSLFGGNSSDKEKKRLLNELKKSLKTKSKFYKVKGNKAQPALAKVFYNIYQTIGPSGIILQKASGSNLLKEVLIESFLSKEQKEIVINLTPEKIRERGQGTNLKELKEKVKQDLIQILLPFTPETAKKINLLYTNLLRFKDFANFDYYLFLKKFDSAFPDNNYTYSARFEGITGQYIIEDLKDFISVSLLINDQVDWNTLFDILKQYREIDVVAQDKWKKVLNQKKDLVNSGYLLSLTQYLDEDPFYKPTIEKVRFEIVNDYLNRLKKNVEETLASILRERKNKQIDALSMEIFGSTSISRTQNYTEKMDIILKKKSTSGYAYIKPFNFLKAFYLDFFKSNVREITDLLVIEGQWATNLQSQQVSELYHRLLAYSERLLEFDSSLAEDDLLGARINKIIRISGKDGSAARTLQDIINEVDDLAKGIINDSITDLFAFAIQYKNLIDDFRTKKGKVIVNWKSINSRSGGIIEARMKECYSVIYKVIQLIQIFVKPEKKQPKNESSGERE